MMHKKVNQKLLKENLNYCPESGVFTWITSRQKVKFGKIAGSITKNGYVVIGLGGMSHYAHRLVFLYLNGRWPKHRIDHENSIRNDNRLKNLKKSYRIPTKS